MSNFDTFNNDGQQFVISNELLELIRWLFEHEHEALKALVSRSLTSGLADILKKQHTATAHESIEELQLNIVEFFTLLETLLHETLEEEEVSSLMQKQLIPAINQIDRSSCTNNTLANSVAKATTRYENNPNQNPKDLFFKELIKQWKPSKKTIVN